VKLARARAFVEAVAADDFDAAEEFLDPEVETETPRGTVRGIPACRQVLEKASGTVRWRETGEVAYERDFGLRLTLEDERIVRIVVMPGGAPPP
jgi:hypothetical protein